MYIYIRTRCSALMHQKTWTYFTRTFDNLWIPLCYKLHGHITFIHHILLRLCKLISLICILSCAFVYISGYRRLNIEYICCSCLAGLEHKVHALLTMGIRENTSRTYSSAQRDFLKFCHEFHLLPLPASEQTLLLYIAYTQARAESRGNARIGSIKASSLHVYLAAIRSLHVMQGHPPPPTASPRVQLVLKAIDEAGPGPARKFPITYVMLGRICHLFSDSYDDKVWQAALTLGFFGALRGAEFALDVSHSGNPMSPPLLLSQLSFGHDHGRPFMLVKVSRSKTMPHGFVKPIGCTATPICAVCAMWSYLLNRKTRESIFPHSYVFQFGNGVVLSKAMLNSKIKSLVSALHLDPSKFSSHSLRAGAATTAGLVGFADWEIKSLGGWASSTYTSYIRQADSHQLVFARRLAQIN